jgi:hypothetical protein
MCGLYCFDIRAFVVCLRRARVFLSREDWQMYPNPKFHAKGFNCRLSARSGRHKHWNKKKMASQVEQGHEAVLFLIQA